MKECRTDRSFDLVHSLVLRIFLVVLRSMDGPVIVVPERRFAGSGGNWYDSGIERRR